MRLKKHVKYTFALDFLYRVPSSFNSYKIPEVSCKLVLMNSNSISEYVSSSILKFIVDGYFVPNNPALSNNSLILSKSFSLFFIDRYSLCFPLVIRNDIANFGVNFNRSPCFLHFYNLNTFPLFFLYLSCFGMPLKFGIVNKNNSFGLGLSLKTYDSRLYSYCFFSGFMPFLFKNFSNQKINTVQSLFLTSA